MSELLEKILSKDNMNAAYKRVCANKGAGSINHSRSGGWEFPNRMVE